MESVVEKDLPQLPMDDQEDDTAPYDKVADEMTRLNITPARQPDTPPSSGENTPAPGELEPERPATPNNRPKTASSTRPLTASSNFASDSYFPTTPPDQTDDSWIPPTTGGGLQRRSSVWSLSRVPFSAQLHRLTSLALPLSDELSERIKQLPTAQEACKVISGNAHQIHQWIEHAKNILKGLDADDDVEWAAQGKDSLGEVDGAIQKFSTLVTAYVSVIEDLQTRPDIVNVSEKQITEILETMEVTLDQWADVKKLLKDVKDQVETAMEWTELWTSVLHDIQAELEACQTLVFEMEERRHMSMMDESLVPTMDIDTLETIVEETPSKQQPKTAVSPSIASDEHMLLGLFARMQPLRASLDFLPMRIDAFEYRAKDTFPGACEDLTNRKKSLEKKWLKLNSDADVLRRELGEDRWVAIFRNAGKQAGNMIESADRSLKKLREALESGRSSEASVMKKIESYETKKVHYGKISVLSHI
jgi:DNA repair exonuclease SbcCD ATPase subunit